MENSSKNVSVNKPRQKFDKAFKLNAVSMLHSKQQTATQLALKLGIRRNLLYKWAEALARCNGDAAAAFNGSGVYKRGITHDPLRAENQYLKRELARADKEIRLLKESQARLINQLKEMGLPFSER